VTTTTTTTKAAAAAPTTNVEGSDLQLDATEGSPGAGDSMNTEPESLRTSDVKLDASSTARQLRAGKQETAKASADFSDSASPLPSISSSRESCKRQLVLSLRKAVKKPATEKMERQRRLDNHKYVASQIYSDLFVSGEGPPSNKSMLVSMGITHIVNCARKGCRNHFEDSFDYLNFWIDDSPGTNIDFLFYEVLEYVIRAKASNGRVLIHCRSGVSRSCAFVISLLIAREGMSFRNAFDKVVGVRPICNPNAGFCSQLLDFAKRFERLSPRGKDHTATEEGEHAESATKIAIKDDAPSALSRTPAPPRLYVVTALAKHSGRPIARLSRRSYGTQTPRGSLGRRHIYLLVDPRRRCAFGWIGSECAASESYRRKVISALRITASRIVRLDRRENVLSAGRDVPFSALREGSETPMFLQILGELDGKIPNDENSDVVSVMDCQLMKMSRKINRSSNGETGYLQSPRPSVSGSSISGGGESQQREKPTLHQWHGAEKKWEELRDYEADDLISTELYILFGSARSFVWRGQHFDESKSKYDEVVQLFFAARRIPVPERVELVSEYSEPEAFWESFEDGF